MSELYADIILPIAAPVFTFSLSEQLAQRVEIGSAVSVQFGQRKIVTGIIRRIHDQKPPYKNIKPVLEVLFSKPVVNKTQMQLWEWIAQYYMCTLGEVMRSAIPPMLKPSGYSNEEFARDSFKSRKMCFVSLSPDMNSEQKLSEVCEKIRKRAPKQHAAIIEIVEELGERLFGGEVARAALGSDTTILNALKKRGVICIAEREVAQSEYATEPFSLPLLTTAQQKAFEELEEAFRSKQTALLFGVPSAGKSEVCFHAIAATLEKGQDALLLLPEISLSTQFVKRVRRVFGDRVTLYHSALSERKRADAYVSLMQSRGGSLIVGVRSAIFLPVKQLGLIVVDEEQDPSYKQQEPAPRYNARDTALVLARFCNARVILSSATPSLETWSNALWGKYGLVRLTERYGNAPPPEVIISDTIRSVKRGERKSHFNKELLDRMRDRLADGGQVILFQNRRGIAPYMECGGCGFIPGCLHCGIPMSVHRSTLRCHYCGASSKLPTGCSKCGGTELETRGFGTEKIEEEIAKLFPQARIARLDRDSATSESAYNRIISGFESGAADILIGTQMVTKGLDFAGVSLVGILNADNLLNHPDFRASERAYQLIAQVSGRSGRRGKQGEVVIQTASPGNRIINQAACGDYAGMAADMLEERAIYHYPPYSRLVSVSLCHRNRELLYAGAQRFGEILSPDFGERLLGPQPPTVERIKGEYALVYLIKVPREKSMSNLREMVEKAVSALHSELRFKKITVTANIDPQ